MATGGSISISSDEVLDHMCSVCKNKNISTKASVYCVDCKDYYCNVCVDIHKTVPILKDHVILSKDAGDGGKLPSLPTSRYDRHTKNIIDMCCQDHDEVGCTKCMILEHDEKCKSLFDIPEFVQYNTNIVPEFIKTVEDIERELKNRLNIFHQEQEGLQQNKKDVIENIEATKDRLIDIIMKQTEDTIQNVEEKYDELNNQLQTKLNELNNELIKLDKLLKDMKSVSYNVPQSFVISKKSKDVVSRAEQLKHDIELVNTGKKLQFSLDKLYGKVLSCEISNLGDVLVGPTSQLYKLSKIKDIDVGYVQDACCTTNGSVFFAVYRNKWLYRICNDTLNIGENLHLKSSPRGVCCVSNTNIAVSLGRTIQIIDITGALKLTDNIKVDRDIRGLYYHDDIFYVTSEDSVYKYSWYGKLLKSYRKYPNGNKIFFDINNLVVNPQNRHIHLTDAENGVITMNQEGHVLNVVTDNISEPCGLCLDQYGQVLVSGYKSNNIIQLSCDGRYITTVIRGLSGPTGICFDTSRAMFYIGEWQGKLIKVYTVENVHE